MNATVFAAPRFAPIGFFGITLIMHVYRLHDSETDSGSWLASILTILQSTLTTIGSGSESTHPELAGFPDSR
jgi:uncharacterized membrane protein YhaH (DUF805 family)